MKVIDEFRFQALVTEGQIVQKDCQFIDGIKIGLRIRPMVRTLPATVDLSSGDLRTSSVNLRKSGLQPNKLYLAQSVEQISTSDRIFGLLHTRSSIARLGIDCMGSSTYVAPGFGHGTAASLVLEIRSTNCVKNLPLEQPLAGLLLFELDSAVRVASAGPQEFPF
jgi:deoxycytidine triphosphate deaminase